MPVSAFIKRETERLCGRYSVCKALDQKNAPRILCVRCSASRMHLACLQTNIIATVIGREAERSATTHFQLNPIELRVYRMHALLIGIVRGASGHETAQTQ